MKAELSFPSNNNDSNFKKFSFLIIYIIFGLQKSSNFVLIKELSIHTCIAY